MRSTSHSQAVFGNLEHLHLFSSPTSNIRKQTNIFVNFKIEANVRIAEFFQQVLATFSYTENIRVQIWNYIVGFILLYAL